MVGVKRSLSYEAKRKRIQRLPKVGLEAIEMSSKRLAAKTITVFHEGIKADKFGLMPLKDATISRKEALGMELPSSPLYGFGDDDESKETYANMLRVYKDEARRKFTIRPLEGYHHQSDAERKAKRKPVELKVLFRVHEYGCTIANGFGKGLTIRIPPRPALHTAFRQVMAEVRKGDRSRTVKAAIAKLIRTGDEALVREITKRDPDMEKWDADSN